MKRRAWKLVPGKLAVVADAHGKAVALFRSEEDAQTVIWWSRSYDAVCAENRKLKQKLQRRKP